MWFARGLRVLFAGGFRRVSFFRKFPQAVCCNGSTPAEFVLNAQFMKADGKRSENGLKMQEQIATNISK
jgi:hypothetical protein